MLTDVSLLACSLPVSSYVSLLYAYCCAMISASEHGLVLGWRSSLRVRAQLGVGVDDLTFMLIDYKNPGTPHKGTVPTLAMKSYHSRFENL